MFYSRKRQPPWQRCVTNIQLSHISVILTVLCAMHHVLQAPYPLLPNYGFGATRSGFLDLLMLTLFNASERNLDQFKELGYVFLSAVNVVHHDAENAWTVNKLVFDSSKCGTLWRRGLLNSLAIERMITCIRAFCTRSVFWERNGISHMLSY